MADLNGSLFINGFILHMLEDGEMWPVKDHDKGLDNAEKRIVRWMFNVIQRWPNTFGI